MALTIPATIDEAAYRRLLLEGLGVSPLTIPPIIDTQTFWRMSLAALNSQSGGGGGGGGDVYLAANNAFTGENSFSQPITTSRISSGSIFVNVSSGGLGSGFESLNWIDSSLYDNSESKSLDWNNRQLKNGVSASLDWSTFKLLDTNVADSVDWNSRILVSGDGVTTAINWGPSKSLHDGAGTPSVDWGSRILLDSGTSTIVDWQNQFLYNGGGAVLGWSAIFQVFGPAQINGTLDMANNLISNALDPVDPQDVATRAYVDLAPRILATVTSINAKTVAATNLYTVPTGKSAVITAAIIRSTNAASITVGPTLGIGVAAGEDDIFASTVLTNLTTNLRNFGFANVGITARLLAGSVIKVGIDTASTGTSQLLAVDLIGYLY